MKYKQLGDEHLSWRCTEESTYFYNVCLIKVASYVFNFIYFEAVYGTE